MFFCIFNSVKMIFIFSLRTLCRALKQSATNMYGNVQRSLYEVSPVGWLFRTCFVSKHNLVLAQQSFCSYSCKITMNIKTIWKLQGFCLSFLTQLDRSSHPVVKDLIRKHILGNASLRGLLKQTLPEPPGGTHLCFEGYWLSKGSREPHVSESYVMTPSVRENLRDLARIVSAG